MAGDPVNEKVVWTDYLLALVAIAILWVLIYGVGSLFVDSRSYWIIISLFISFICWHIDVLKLIWCSRKITVLKRKRQ